MGQSRDILKNSKFFKIALKNLSISPIYFTDEKNRCTDPNFSFVIKNIESKNVQHTDI